MQKKRAMFGFAAGEGANGGFNQSDDGEGYGGSVGISVEGVATVVCPTEAGSCDICDSGGNGNVGFCEIGFIGSADGEACDGVIVEGQGEVGICDACGVSVGVCESRSVRLVEGEACNAEAASSQEGYSRGIKDVRGTCDIRDGGGSGSAGSCELVSAVARSVML